MMPTAITALSAFSVDQDGTETWAKDPDLQTHGRSTVKLLTCAAARTIITDVSAAYTMPSPLYGVGIFEVGDTVSISDLFHTSLISSDQIGTSQIANIAQAQLGSHFRTYVQTWAGTTLGWVGHVIDDLSGFGTTNRFTAREIVACLEWVRENDPWLYSVAGKLSHTVEITGGRTASIGITHTAASSVSLVPEFDSGKTGSNGEVLSAEAYIVMGWDHPDGTTHTLAVMESTIADRYSDVRAVLDDVISASAQPRRRAASVVGLI